MPKGYGGTNSGMGGFMSGASIRFSKMRGSGVGGVDAWRDQLASAANSQGSSVLSNRARTSGTKLPKLHSVHSGTVVSMQPFGAFVQLGKGDTYKDGLLHVSCLCADRVEAPEEAGLKLGMSVWVKVCEVKEDDGKYGLDIRFVDQRDGKDLDPYQAKGRPPDNHFQGAAKARPRRAPEEASERPPAPQLSLDPTPDAEPRARARKRKGSDSSDSGDGAVPNAAEVAAKVEKMRRKVEKQRQKLEKARRKAEKKAEKKAQKAGKKAKKEKKGGDSGSDISDPCASASE